MSIAYDTIPTRPARRTVAFDARNTGLKGECKDHRMKADGGHLFSQSKVEDIYHCVPCHGYEQHFLFSHKSGGELQLMQGGKALISLMTP